jgi:uncharacterized protein YaiI (UPF0178 family)
LLKESIEIYVDADACPVKNEIIKVANRHTINVHMVSDGGIRPYLSPLVNLIIVAQGADAADDWIAEHVEAGDIVITNDIPLAARCLEKGSKAIKPNGTLFTNNSIGIALATRDLMQTLRESGEVTGGPRPFKKKDRSDFLNALEVVVRKSNKENK